jgi:MFS family permease
MGMRMVEPSSAWNNADDPPSFDTGSIGAITEMSTFQAQIGVLTPIMRGLTVSLLLLAGAPASLFAGVLADKFGHLSITFVGAVIFTIGAALESGAVNLAMLLVGRSLVGVGEGLYLGNMNVYICEIAPKARRGTLVAMPQLLVTAGICVGYFTCYATIHIQNQWQWRLPFIVQVAGGAILALACLLLPASPRWLLLNDKPQIAMRNLKKLDLTEDELLINSDIPLHNTEDVSPRRPQPQTSLSWRVVSDLFRKEYRFRTTLALFILGMVQLCGIDGVLYVCYCASRIHVVIIR